MGNRLVQRFVGNAAGDIFAAVVNHSKSKASSGFDRIPLPEKTLIIGDLNTTAGGFGISLPPSQ